MWTKRHSRNAVADSEKLNRLEAENVMLKHCNGQLDSEVKRLLGVIRRAKTEFFKDHSDKEASLRMLEILNEVAQ